MYWKCQNKYCGSLKEVKQSAYECDSCHLMHSDIDYFSFESNKVILKCSCGYSTLVSVYLLKTLPREIINLRKLKRISLEENSDLVLTEEQKEWLRELENNQCEIYIDIDYSKKKEIEIVEVDKEENFTIDRKEEPLLNRFLKWFR